MLDYTVILKTQARTRREPRRQKFMQEILKVQFYRTVPRPTGPWAPGRNRRNETSRSKHPRAVPGAPQSTLN